MKRTIPLLPALLLPLLSAPARANTTTANACADAYVQGQLLRNDHKLIQAREVLRACAQSSCKDFIERECSEWLDMVQASLPAVVLVASDDEGNALYDVKVSLDGAALVATLDGRSIDVDPGPHTFAFEASDGRKADRSVVVSEGDRRVRIAIAFPRPSTERSVAPIQPPALSPVISRTSPSDDASTVAQPAAPWKTVGLAVAGVGALGLATGAYLGFDAISKKGAAGCDLQGRCEHPDLFYAAHRSGDIANWFLVTGAAVAVSGTILWVLAPARSLRTAAHVENGGASFAVSGAW